ncbi:hypothetical protein POM88_025365 [Heracleum sosnowskyi]|uniref:Replication protein A 70 kDa DNA-binding subunit B/D first OB fold domain-containing protein n=1 Tax=Heracleum sosnowskyi TaxID=360622 RepID=A0AAD8I442_9APIA|nr:hypothetical protein POM88_025365 [Heracleum sosnowskyi]
MYDKLKNLDESRSNWKIKVRVTRMWPSISYSQDILHGFNFILIDDENHHVHAFALPEDWNKFLTVILEGRLYEISDFYAKRAQGHLRSVSSEFKIYFTDSTVVRPILIDDLQIPMHKFEFVDFNQIHKFCFSHEQYGTPDQAFDVIGVMEELQPVTSSDSKCRKNQVVRFVISDGRFLEKDIRQHD